MKLATFFYYKIQDFYQAYCDRKEGIVHFNEYGLDLFCGSQGGGKTMSLVNELEIYRQKYPNLLICTNFGYIHQDLAVVNFEDLIELPKLAKANGYCGLVIGWDEIQNDFDNQTRTFPISILRTLTQQRKQGIKILATSQVYTTVHKRIREQTFNVIDCKTLMGRWSFQKWYSPKEYEFLINNPDKKKNLSINYKYNFIQTDDMRALYDSYSVIDNLEHYKEKESIPLEIRLRDGYIKNDVIIQSNT